MTACLCPERIDRRRVAVRRDWSSVATELAVVAAVFLLYRSGRLLSRDASEVAVANAERVVGFERALGIHTERAVQAFVLGQDGWIEVLNRYYVWVHFPATVALLVWLFVRHRARYAPVRNWFVVVTLTALVVHVVFPLAPPRMTPGFVDTLREFGPSIYTDDPTRSVANQFAAMPSLHFGWALMVGTVVAVVHRARWAWIALVHPAVTLVAIVATGNHYWLDAMVAGAIVAVSAVVVVRWWTTVRPISRGATRSRSAASASGR